MERFTRPNGGTQQLDDMSSREADHATRLDSEAMHLEASHLYLTEVLTFIIRLLTFPIFMAAYYYAPQLFQSVLFGLLLLNFVYGRNLTSLFRAVFPRVPIQPLPGGR